MSAHPKLSEKCKCAWKLRGGFNSWEALHLRRTFQRMRMSRRQTTRGIEIQARRDTPQRKVAPQGCERENRTLEWKIPSLGSSSMIPRLVRWSKTRMVSPRGTPADSESTREVGAGRRALQLHSSLDQEEHNATFAVRKMDGWVDG